MSNKPKIHVFLGAPCPETLALDVQEKELTNWKTIDLTWRDGNLIPKDNVKEVQRHDKCGEVVNQGTEGSTRLYSAVVPEREPVAQTSEDKSKSQGSSSKGQCIEEEQLCPVSVTEYLDDCFSSSQTNANPGQSNDERSSVSVETEYLSSWTKSQALLLQGRAASSFTLGFPGDFYSPHTPAKQTPSTSLNSPELYSPTTSPEEMGLGGTLQSSVEWHCDSLSQIHQEGGVIMEITTGAILCSQGTNVGHTDKPGDHQEIGLNADSYCQMSPSPTPSKRIKLSSTVAKTKVTEQSTINAVPLCGPTTILVRCKTHGVRYAILVAVVHPCHLKEVKVKTGASAGSSIPLATIIVTDQSDMEMKVVLWRTAAFWTLTVNPGDILLITDVTVHMDKWKNETVLQSSFSSQLLNLGQITRERIPQAWRDEVQGMSRAGGVLKAVLTVEQGDGCLGAVVLWGAALSWLQRLERNKDAVWEFRMLLIRQDLTSGLLELHSTPWGTCQPLFADDNRCKEFYSTARLERTSSSFEIDLNTLLSQKFSGDVELKVKLSAFQFQSSPSQEASVIIDGNTPLERILDIVSGDITFSGCGKCSAELDTDENGIYRPCYPCLPQTGVRRYYRPVVLTVRDGGSQTCVLVPSALVQKILLNTPPDKLNKSIAPASEVRFVQVVADRISSILTDMKNTFLLTIRSHFLCDENSIPVIQNFLLLDFSPTMA
ncbi:Protein FAM35A [Triplophysa tibetana]|uniref:Protein FAM35A n=1 Tax=Triplophysa tibetana TaxID=1572043 RepID=A0A5A9P7Y8_9TELE|nr:Protein FAM35A [Triplophysa tibetana]